MFDINRLLGQNVLLNFITGRYHQPRTEERVFLFIDMEGSAGFAEQLGALGFHRLLNRFVIDLTDAIVVARGEIYSYVGPDPIPTSSTRPAASGTTRLRYLCGMLPSSSLAFGIGKP